ncbi:hypothetical protein JB92DRAFT_3084177 [Gautieria morchelliformis]|nr:hypothetical protein JB92DRAFT_3084177 [Gautieria morchelliformis]
MHRGPSRGSFMWGSSTHNTFATQFSRRWQAFFARHEKLHHLDRLNPHHLWLLQELFLDLINTDCDAFKDGWNNHLMSSTNNRSLLASDIRFLSNAKHGTMVSEYDHIHPDTLQRYYSTHGSIVHHAGLTGAGHPPDEEDLDMDDDSHVSDSEVGDEYENHDALQDQLAMDVQANINHPAISLDQARGTGLIPDGYGVIAAEWEDGYQEYETICVGCRARELVVELPESIWYSRAVVWSQGLHIMQTLVYQLEDI